MQVWKFGLNLDARQVVMMPEGAKLLTVQAQYGEPFVWALCDEHAGRQEYRRFLIYGTGQPLPDNTGEYVGTFQLVSGAMVLHVFEEQ